jgi:putative DNA base modification enzyme with NMAD domain
MRVFSYVVARDYGFAPNPFHGYCTLATCKPRIRARAAVGDWVIGTGAKTKYRLAGHLIYAMKVDEIVTYDAYWSAPQFLSKRPVLNGSLKVMYGDNIYHRTRAGWSQVDSHHSLESGRPNPDNIAHDTSVDRVLIGSKFVYFGEAAPTIPKRFRPFRGRDEEICCPGQGHRVLSHDLAVAFSAWLDELGKWGVQGLPLEFRSHRHAVAGTAAVAHDRRMHVRRRAVRGRRDSARHSRNR